MGRFDRATYSIWFDIEAASGLARTASEMVPLPPEVPSIGPYRFLYPFLLLGPAGHGGMADVHEGWNVNHSRRVAVKVKNRGGTVERLYHEALLGFRDLGPHVVRAYDFHRLGQLDFLELEWVEGRNLEQLSSAGKLTEREVCSLAQQVCAGLGALHALGAVHRDIKPSNILVTCDGVAKVSDLGIAHSDEALHTQTVGAIGTRSFMSPEQLRGDPALDERSDIYSLGMTLFALLGRFYAERRTDDLYRLAAIGGPPSLGTIAPEVHPEFARIVDWCLARDRDRRPRDTSELGAALSALPWTLAQVRFAPRRSPPPEPALEFVHAARRWWALRRGEVETAPGFETESNVPPETIELPDEASREAPLRARPGRRLTLALVTTLVALVGAFAFVPPRGELSESVTEHASGQGAEREPATQPRVETGAAAFDGPTVGVDGPESEPLGSESPPSEPAKSESPEATPQDDLPPPGFEVVLAASEAPRYYSPILTEPLESKEGLRFVLVQDLLVQEVEVSRYVWSEVLCEDRSGLRPAERFLPQTKVALGEAQRFVAALNALVPSEYQYRFAIPTADAMEHIHAAAAGLPGYRLESLAPPRARLKPGEVPNVKDGPYKPTGDVRVKLESTLDAPLPPPLGLKWLLGNVRELALGETLGTVVRFGGSERDRASRVLVVGHRTRPESDQSSDGWDGLRLVIELPRQ